MLDFRRRPPLAPAQPASTWGDDATPSVGENWADSSDFPTFERNADAVLLPAVHRRPIDASDVRTWDYRPARDGRAEASPLLQRAKQLASPTESKAVAEAQAAREKLFDDWDKNPQKEIDSGRFFREKVFDAKPDKNNILVDSIGMYDPPFSKAMREGLKQATPEELEAIQNMRPRNPLQAARIALPGGHINLTPQQRQHFLNMIERAGPDGQKIGASARQYWGMEKRK